MLKQVKASLVNGRRVAELLIERYGPDLVWQVEQLGEHTFRAWLSDGRVALADVCSDGAVLIKEVEAGC